MRIGSAQLRWLVMASAFIVTSCGPAGLQRQDQFDWAIRTGAGSTSPPIVRVRLLDTPNGAGSIRCVFSDTLINAIMIENRLPLTKAGYDKAVSTALATRDHRFRFASTSARSVLTESHGIMDDGLSKGCKLIEQRKSALWADMQGAVVEGPHFPLAGDTG